MRASTHVSAGHAALQGRVVRFGQQDVQDPTIALLLQNVPNSSVSQQFQAQVERGVASLPQPLREGLAKAGWHVLLAKFLTDAFPQLKGVIPRGWDPWTTWDNSDAVCAQPNIGMAEYHWVSTVKKPSKFSKAKSVPRSQRVEPVVVKPNNVLYRAVAADRVVRHEAGHAVDHLFHDISTSDVFQKAYQADFAKMTPEVKEEMYYYIQPNLTTGAPTAAGMSEAFAESLAGLFGGGCNALDHYKKHFKNTMKLVDKLVKGYEQLQKNQGSPESEAA